MSCGWKLNFGLKTVVSSLYEFFYLPHPFVPVIFTCTGIVFLDYDKIRLHYIITFPVDFQMQVTTEID